MLMRCLYRRRWCCRVEWRVVVDDKDEEDNVVVDVIGEYVVAVDAVVVDNEINLLIMKTSWCLCWWVDVVSVELMMVIGDELIMLLMRCSFWWY